MSTAANTIDDLTRPVDRDIPWLQQFVWCVKRELWEHRWLYAVPLALAGLSVVASFFSLFRLASMMQGGRITNLHKSSTEAFLNASLLLMGASFLISLWYSVDCLQSERRDRSILFWKSLPISDATIVLSKMSIPLVLIPLGIWGLTAATHLLMLVVGSVILAAKGQSVGTLWQHVALGQMSVMLFFHMVAGHGLWYAPIYAWLIAASAWARRAALLWATVPILALGLAERIAFGSSHVSDFVRWRFTGGPGGDDFLPSMAEAHPMAHMNAGAFFASPGMWLGLVTAAGLLYAAARLRRYRDPV